ncbi:ABC transporter permease [bacterium]|nr:ABC transporter permease [bacterium]
MRSTALRFYFRHIRSNKLMTLISLLGLAVGMAVSILITLYVTHELSYDRFHPDSDRTYMIGAKARFGGSQEINAQFASAPMPVDLKREINSIEEYLRIEFGNQDVQMRAGVKESVEPLAIYADSSLFDILGYTLAQGDPATALSRPNSIVLARSAVHRLFGEEDPVGETVKLYGSRDYTVTGVFDDVSQSSHLEGFTAVMSWNSRNIQDDQDWMNNLNYLTYLRLQPGTDPDEVVEAMNASAQRHIGETLEQIGGTFAFHLIPLEKIYLTSDFSFEAQKTGSLSYVIQFTAIGIFILLIAVLNYVNLTTARSTKRGKLVGITKSLGASRAQLRNQFLGESLMSTTASMLLAMLLVYLVLPSFNRFLGLDLTLEWLTNPFLIPLVIGSVLVIGLLAGFYPSVVLSTFEPVDVLRGQLVSGGKGNRLRASLVVLQFAISVVLIVSTLVVMQQLSYLRNKDLGYNRDHVLAINLPNWELMQRHEILEHEMSRLPSVLSIASGDQLPNHLNQNSLFHIPGEADEDQLLIGVMHIDHRYMEMMGIQLREGREFDPAISSDSSTSILINEACAQKLGWREVNGRVIEQYESGGMDSLLALNVIGMVHDFHVQSLHTEIRPLILRIYEGEPVWLFFRLEPNSVRATMNELSSIWHDFTDGQVPLNYQFLDDLFDREYRTELKLSSLFNSFTALAIFIACLGLFALATFAAEQRTKEIGIRKVLGASETEIFRLLTIRFMRLVLIANVIAWPIAWYVMNNWLEGFAYRIELGIPLFLVATAISLLIAVVTISTQAIRASLTNPIKALRYE